MSANVRCAGGLVGSYRSNPDDEWVLVGEEVVEPCGWKGMRVADLRAAIFSEPDYNTAATAKPCPRCGGRVELIPQGGGSC